LADLTETAKFWWPILTGVATGIGTLLVFYKRVNRRFIQPYLKRRKNLRLLGDQQEAILFLVSRKDKIEEMLGHDPQDRVMLQQIIGLLTPNGGSSLSDAIHRMERQLAINQTTQRIILVEDTAIMFWADPNGRYNRVSKAYADLVGRAPEEMLNEGWKSHLSVSCRRAVIEEWSFAVRDMREFYMRCELQNHLAHKAFTADVTAYPAKVDNKVVGYVGRITLVQ
jgi:PAS domain-containing protein